MLFHLFSFPKKENKQVVRCDGRFFLFRGKKSESSLVGSYYKLICQEIGFICFARWKAGKDIEYNLTMYIHKKQHKSR